MKHALEGNIEYFQVFSAALGPETQLGSRTEWVLPAMLRLHPRSQGDPDLGVSDPTACAPRYPLYCDSDPLMRGLEPLPGSCSPQIPA